MKLKTQFRQYGLYLAFTVALLSTLVSLFFSEILLLPPCVLCWYQRITMYPLVVILGVGILKKDNLLPFYVLPLSISGALIALYHNLLYYNFIPESLAPCIAGVSCTTRFFEWFGFITIPFLSFLSFTIITAIMVYYLRSERGKLKVL